MRSPASVVTFDIETCKLAADLKGGWSDLKEGKGGISCLVAFASLPGRPFIYDKHTLSQAADLLESADVILSFNGEDFDVPVLEGVLKRKLHIAEHIDLLQVIWEACREYGIPRKGNKLGELAHRCLGRDKTGEGTLAPTLLNEGRFAELHDYCMSDVLLTRDLFKYVQTHGNIIMHNDEKLHLRPFLPPWFFEVAL